MHTRRGLIIAIEIFMGRSPGNDELRRRLWARDEKVIAITLRIR